jgi:hypothetical protein
MSARRRPRPRWAREIEARQADLEQRLAELQAVTRQRQSIDALSSLKHARARTAERPALRKSTRVVTPSVRRRGGCRRPARRAIARRSSTSRDDAPGEPAGAAHPVALAWFLSGADVLSLEGT